MHFKKFVAFICFGSACVLADISHATTLTLRYDVVTVFDDAFARILFYNDPTDPDPYTTIRCFPGHDCYPDNWYPDLGITDGFVPGDTLSFSMAIDLRLVEGKYMVSSLTSTGDIRLPYFSSATSDSTFINVSDLDPATGDITFSTFQNFSSGWIIALAGGVGSMSYATEFGSALPSVSCGPLSPSRSYLPNGFCGAHDAEALFTISSYTVNGPTLSTAPVPVSLIATPIPIPASGLFLATAIAGLLLQRRLRAG